MALISWWSGFLYFLIVDPPRMPVLAARYRGEYG